MKDEKLQKELLGKRIRRLRDRLELTQDELAEAVGLNPKHLSNMERGKENPTFDTLLRLAKALKVEPWEMLLFEEESANEQILRARIANLLDKASTDDELRLIARLLRAALH